MTPSDKCFEFIKREESCRLRSYQDDAGVWTIGWGSTMYKTGRPVGKGEVITQPIADDLLSWEVSNKSKVVAALTQKIKLTQSQFDSLVSFAYNCGVGAFQKSTLLKKILINPSDPFIRACFLMWNKIKVDGKFVVSDGLTGRRKREADLYFS